MVQGREQGLVQQPDAQTSAEAFDEAVLGRLSGREIMTVDLAIIDELSDRVRGQLGPVARWDEAQVSFRPPAPRF